ncbi:MAG: hypothetical protein JXR10_17515 [Cyclobacteriaceae bacterium]
MFKYHVSTYCGSANPQKPHFYVLSKGLNAGKPLDEPCPNCFLVATETEESKQLFYWLCYALWKSGYFRRHLVGSVIPFLRINDLRIGLQIVGKHYP